MSKRLEWTLAVLANLCSVGGVLWAIFASNTGCRLTYAVSPTPTVIADPTRTSKIEVRVLGETEAVKKPVLASQIVLYSDGDHWIEPHDFTDDPIVIVTDPRTPLIDAIEKVTRPKVTGFKVDRSKLDEGIVPVTWKLLQKGDGALITLYYKAGSAATRFRVAGVLKPQPEMIRIPTDPVEKRAREALLTPALIAAAVTAFLLFAGVLFAAITRKTRLQIFFGIAFFVITSIVTWNIVRATMTPKMPFPL